MRFHIETMGCQMNKADSELVAGLLAASGFEEVSHPAQADVVLVNGCVVRAKAEEKAMTRVRQLLRAPWRPKVGLIGCAAQWRGDSLFAELPGLHLAASPSRLDEIPALIETGGGALGHVPWSAIQAGARRCPGTRAWIPVMRGCDHRCTFCVVPRTRGPEVSFPPSYIMRHAREAVAAGYVELDLLGQRVSAYRHAELTFAGLVRRLAVLPGVKRIRFTAPYPSDIEDELLCVMAGEPTVEHRLHLPLQSGSDRILARMGRGYTVAQYVAIVEKARRLMPDFGLSTDLIVGFPGETAADYQATESIVADLGFDTAFTFMFSPRAGTPAALMDDQVPREVKKERLARLIAVHHDTLRARLKEALGRRMDVVVEGYDAQEPGYSVGKGSNGRVAVLPGQYELGSVVSIKVTGVRGHTLCGEPTTEA